MKNKLFLFGLAVFIYCQSNIIAQEKYKSITGKWNGAIIVPNAKLEMLIKLEEKEGFLLAKMDVPMQGAKDIQASKATFVNDSLIIEFAVMRGFYRGLFMKDSSLFMGIWQQNGASLPMKLIRGGDISIKRPQNPVKPYPYNEEEVVFENKKDNVKLAGTFTWPKDKKNCPVAVLISGSGPQNRDADVLGHKLFLVVSDYLTRNGIAVLRYDDRGTASSTGDFKTANSLDFSYDAEAAVEYLKTRKEIDIKKIGLIGHSEGGLIAPLLASRKKELAFIVMVAGPGIKVIDLMILQAAAQAGSMGASEANIETGKALNKKIYTFAASDSPNVADSIRAILSKSGMGTNEIEKNVKSMTSPWYRYFIAYDPNTTLPKVTCPILALNGKKDLQVTYPENLNGIDAILKKGKNKNYITIAYDDLNHLMQHCKTGAFSEYSTIEETFSTEVLKFMAEWINLR